MKTNENKKHTNHQPASQKPFFGASPDHAFFSAERAQPTPFFQPKAISPSAIQAKSAEQVQAKVTGKAAQHQPKTNEQDTEKDLNTLEQKTESLTDIRVGVMLDMDEDGKAEQHTLRFQGVGADAELMINSDPQPLEAFVYARPILQHPQLLSWMLTVQTLQQSTISAVKASMIRQLLTNIANFMSNTATHNVVLADAVVPQTRVVQWTARNIQAQLGLNKSINENVTDHIKIAPLTSKPGLLNGSSVANANTPYMNELHKYAGYIRGHMLNAKLHGPGNDNVNLVPISRKMNSQMAANGNIEQFLKLNVLSRNQVVSYEVIPQGWGNYQGAAQANAETKLPTSINFTVKQMVLSPGLVDRNNPANWIETNNVLFQDNMQHHIPQDTTSSFDPTGNVTNTLPFGTIQLDKCDRIEEVPNRPGVWAVEGFIYYDPVPGLTEGPLGIKYKKFNQLTLVESPTDSLGTKAIVNNLGTTLEVYTPYNKTALDTYAADQYQKTREGNLYKRVEELLNKAAEEYHKINKNTDKYKELESQINETASNIEQLFSDLMEWVQSKQQERQDGNYLTNAEERRTTWQIEYQKYTMQRMGLDSRWRGLLKKCEMN
ncbi:hypothetical protein [Calothrix sp. 336/3]|uniref:hypothetical protein n=1 Tax=Calothrix sp. 336/3 TaxID=1337936 RepID=UPI0004E36687|nr:hypothetical protein [Calothrix sp. 336/3]AKG21575.1 hypothetical protein IJ00_10075 [Calothrix sp. 336/3]